MFHVLLCAEWVGGKEEGGDLHHTYACATWHLFICVKWLIHMCDMTPAYVWRDSFICLTWLRHMCDMTHSCVCHDSCIRVTWLILACDMTRAYVWYDSCIRVTWRLHMCALTHSYVWRDWCICVPWLMHICDMSHSYVWHDAFIYLTRLIYMRENVQKCRQRRHISCVYTPLRRIHDCFSWARGVDVTWLKIHGKTSEDADNERSNEGCVYAPLGRYAHHQRERNCLWHLFCFFCMEESQDTHAYEEVDNQIILWLYSHSDMRIFKSQKLPP